MGGSAVTPGANTTYEEYYGFAHSPFTLSPDPQFLFLSESHEEALLLLQESVRRREGFIVLTGDVGTGKTTIGRALLSQLDRTCFSSLVLNPFLSVDELLREVLLVGTRPAILKRLWSTNAHMMKASKHTSAPWATSINWNDTCLCRMISPCSWTSGPATSIRRNSYLNR